MKISFLFFTFTINVVLNNVLTEKVAKWKHINNFFFPMPA